MSSDSDCAEQFFDAEDNTPVRNARSTSKSSLLNMKNVDLSEVKSSHLPVVRQDTSETESSLTNSEPIPTFSERKEIERRAQENEKRRRRLEELRKKVQNDDDDSYDIVSQTSSQTSSVDSMYVPFKSNGTEDVQSMISLGKIGQILSGSDSVSLSGQDNENNRIHISTTSTISDSVPNEHEENRILLQEPDVVASTKGDRPSDLQPPVAPPRRKRRNRQVPASSTVSSKEVVDVPNPPSPSSTTSSFDKEFEHSLDLKSAIKGQYVVKPQDEEKDKAEGPPLMEERFLNVKMDETDGAVDEEGRFQQLNMVVRTRTDSGKPLTDLEILEQVMVLNLDTGEQIPLSLAEDRLPRCINPLSLHIMRLTSEYVSNSSLDKDKESDEDGDELKKTDHLSEQADGATSNRKTKRIKKLINKTMNKLKSVADEVYHARHNDDAVESSEDEPTGDQRQAIKVLERLDVSELLYIDWSEVEEEFKSASGHKGPYEFDNLKLIQDLTGEHCGAVWTMKFSYCGRLLATAGQDHILRVWVLKDAYDYFNNMRQKYNTESKISPTPSQESLASHHSTEDGEKTANIHDTDFEGGNTVFIRKPFCMYTGHTADLLDVSWSKNYFILSSSMDKTVRLWHISRKECLCCFQHIDFVTAIAFHPRDDRYFISGSLDGKLRLWNIPDKKVALWNELDGQTKLITAANFCQNGKYAIVGSYDGRCIFYNTEQLKYYTQIHVRSTRGKNAKGRKISGIEPMPGEDKILITSNDSRIRLYDLRDLSVSCKYKGYVNLSSQIRASFSHDGKYIISGSENQYFYAWKTHHDYSKFSSARRDRNEYWEGVKAHNAVVTAAVFAPKPSLICRQLEKDKGHVEEVESASASAMRPEGAPGYVIVTADFSGGIKIFANKSKVKNNT